MLKKTAQIILAVSIVASIYASTVLASEVTGTLSPTGTALVPVQSEETKPIIGTASSSASPAKPIAGGTKSAHHAIHHAAAAPRPLATAVIGEQDGKIVDGSALASAPEGLFKEFGRADPANIATAHTDPESQASVNGLSSGIPLTAQAGGAMPIDPAFILILAGLFLALAIGYAAHQKTAAAKKFKFDKSLRFKSWAKNTVPKIQG